MLKKIVFIFFSINKLSLILLIIKYFKKISIYKVNY